MDTKEFKNWIIENDIWKRTIEHFWECFENYRIEEPIEFEKYFNKFNKDMLKLSMNEVALKIKHWEYLEDGYNENQEYVEGCLYLEYDDLYIGYYSLLFNFSGESFDDYFVLE